MCKARVHACVCEPAVMCKARVHVCEPTVMCKAHVHACVCMCMTHRCVHLRRSGLAVLTCTGMESAVSSGDLLTTASRGPLLQTSPPSWAEGSRVGSWGSSSLPSMQPRVLPSSVSLI